MRDGDLAPGPPTEASLPSSNPHDEHAGGTPDVPSSDAPDVAAPEPTEMSGVEVGTARDPIPAADAEGRNDGAPPDEATEKAADLQGSDPPASVAGPPDGEAAAADSDEAAPADEEASAAQEEQDAPASVEGLPHGEAPAPTHEEASAVHTQQDAPGSVEGPPVDEAPAAQELRDTPASLDDVGPGSDGIEGWKRARGGTVLIAPDGAPAVPSPPPEAVGPSDEPVTEPEPPVEAASAAAGDGAPLATTTAVTRPRRRVRLMTLNGALAVGIIACAVAVVLMLTSRASEARRFDRAYNEAARGLVASVDGVVVKLDQYVSRGDADVALLATGAEESLAKATSLPLPIPRGKYRSDAQSLRLAADRIVGFDRALASLAARDGLDVGFEDTARVTDAWEEVVAAMKPVVAAEPSVPEPSWTMWERVVRDAMTSLVETAEAEKRALELHERQIRDRQTARADLQRYRDRMVGFLIRYKQLRDSLGQFRGSERIIDSAAAQQQFETTFLQAAAARESLLAEMKAATAPPGMEDIHTGMTGVLERQAEITGEAADAAAEAYCYRSYFYSTPCETVGTTTTYQEFVTEGAVQLEQFLRLETDFHTRYEALVRRLYQR